MFHHIQILKCLHHIPDERMKQISELELKGKILCFSRFWSQSNLHSSQLYKILFPQSILSYDTFTPFHMLFSNAQGIILQIQFSSNISENFPGTIRTLSHSLTLVFLMLHQYSLGCCFFCKFWAFFPHTFLKFIFIFCFVDHLLYTRHCFRCQGYNGKQNRKGPYKFTGIYLPG